MSSATSSSYRSDDPPPPPQCIVSYFFVDEDGENAFICIADDTSEYAWDGYGATVFHPYLDGFIVGLQVDLPSLCGEGVPVCTVEPSSRCVTPPQEWSADGNPYALCRTNDGVNDLLEAFWQGRGGNWYALASWDVAIVCGE